MCPLRVSAVEYAHLESGTVLMGNQSIGFIGGGNMAGALIGGLIDGGFPASEITVSDCDVHKLAALEAQYGINISDSNVAVVEASGVVVLAVKPQVIRQAAGEISAAVQTEKPVVISIAAGIRERDIRAWLGDNTGIVRCMPNTPALVRSGATAMHANEFVSDADRGRAESILRSVGLVVWVDKEEHLDSVTALSGSGPAYFFLLMEAMERAALELGMDAETARLLIEQTAFGAAKVALEVDEIPAELRRRVTSPGGTTERAVQMFENGGIYSLVSDALKAARDRSIEMSDELGDS